MVWDPSSSVFVPVLFILTTCKLEKIYKRILYDIDELLGQEWKPSSIICDFETGLLAAIR